VKYRKKSIVFDAIQFDYELFVSKGHAAYPMVDGDFVESLNNVSMTTKNPKIRTLEGDMKVSDGDWIITGVQGEHYACRKDIFEKTYEVAT